MMAAVSTADTLPLSYLRLDSKPTAQLSYSLVPAKQALPSQPPIIFLNGLGLPASSWYPTLSLLSNLPSHPTLVAYDRFGQGSTTDRDPQDANAPDPAHGHTCEDVVEDLHQFLTQLLEREKLSIRGTGVFFVGNSVGCAIARLYAQAYPGTVSAMLMLDSVMANTDFISMWPDPDAHGFKESELPKGVTAEALRETRAKYDKIFGSHDGLMGKAEGLSRRDLAELLPFSDRPGPCWGGNAKGSGPWITVVGHGFEKFAQDGLEVNPSPPTFPTLIICSLTAVFSM